MGSRFAVLFVVFLALTGCGLPLRSDIVVNAPAPLVPTLGMSRPQVEALMSKKVVMGYEIDAAGIPKPVEVKNLYSSEKMVINGEIYWIDQYITNTPQAGRPVTRDALTPMIYKGDILAGIGREGLAALTAAHEK
jgi:hypothetical protein